MTRMMIKDQRELGLMHVAGTMASHPPPHPHPHLFGHIRHVCVVCVHVCVVCVNLYMLCVCVCLWGV